MTTNEAAERLRQHLSELTSERVYSVAWLDALDAALAAERRATVERIRGPIQTYLTIGKRWVDGKVSDAEWEEVQRSFQAAIGEVAARG